MNSPLHDVIPTTDLARGRPLPVRVVAATAIALAASLIVQNVVVLATGAPGYGDPITKVLAFHAEHRGAVASVVALEALNIPLLLGFLAALHALVKRRGGAGEDWSRLAMTAGAALAAIFAVYAVLWDGVVLSAAELATPSPEFALVWQLHAAAFALAMPALGTTFAAAAQAAYASGLAARWQRLLGLAGGASLVVAGAANLAIADGSSLLYVGMPGYVLWIVWLLATGVRHLRRRTADRRRFLPLALLQTPR